MPSANQNKGPVTQYVPVTVAQGIETKIDPNLVQPPKGLQADNVRLTTLGAHRKRYGQQVLPSVGSGSVNVASTQQQLIALNNNQLSAYDLDDAIWVPNNYPSVPANSLSSVYLGTQSALTSSGINNPSFAYIGDVGIFCYDFYEGTGSTSLSYYISITCFDVNTGQVFWNKQTNAAKRATGTAGYYLFNHGATSPGSATTQFGLRNVQVVAYGNQFVLTFEEDEILTSGPYGSQASYLRCFVFAPSRTAAINLYTGTNCTQLDNFAFPTYWGTSANSLSLPSLQYCAARNTTDLTIAANGTNIGTDAHSQIACMLTNTQPLTQTSTFSQIRTNTSAGTQVSPIICSMSDGLTCSMLALQTGAYAVQTATGALTGFSAFTAWSPSATLATPFDVKVVGSSATAFTWTATDGYQIMSGTGSGVSAPTQSSSAFTSVLMASSGSAKLVSRIVIYNGSPCAWIVLPGAKFPSLLFVSLAQVNFTNPVLARAFYLQVATAGGSRAPTAVMLNGNPAALLLQASEDAADNLQYAKLVSVVPAQNQVIRTPDGAIITGADTKYYDNQIVRSAGWLKIPELSSAITQTSTGGLQSGFQYSYILVLADFDSVGNAIYSSPSEVFYFTPTATGVGAQLNISAVYPATLFSATGPVLFVYRNSYTDPLSYNLVISQYMYIGSPATVTDTTADNNISNAELYSQPAGGEQPNDPAPPSTCGVATKTRVFLAGAERGSALYFSKPFFAGRAPEFNYGNVLDIEPSTGPIVGLGALDDVVVIFKSSYIYLLSGQGPDATGSGVFSDIANISTDRGLVDKNSLVLTNDGLYFRSQRGIELLDRSYNISYVGQSVEGLLKGATIVSAVSVPAESQVRFALSTGQTIVYDYTAQGWTTYTYNLSSVTGTPITSSQTLFNGVPYSATNGTNGGQIYAEGANTFLDDSNLYPYTVQSAHMPLAGPQGWGRVRRCNILGVTTSIPSRISVQFVYDYGQVTSSAITYDITQVGAFNIRVRAPRQVAQAVSVIVQNVTSSGTGEGSYITGIVLETSQKSGALRLPDSQSV